MLLDFGMAVLIHYITLVYDFQPVSSNIITLSLSAEKANCLNKKLKKAVWKFETK